MQLHDRLINKLVGLVLDFLELLLRKRIPITFHNQSSYQRDKLIS